MDDLIALDREAFLILNGLHQSWLDQPMYLLSERLIWVPLYALLLYLIYRKYRSDTWIVVIGIIVMVTLSDQLASAVMKPLFERLRPSRDPSLEGMVHIVNNYRGGLYGFASSHAANTFGVATFVCMMLPEKKYLLVLFAWAAFVSYTRIYLGVHYPGDIVAGAIVGALCAWLSVRITHFLVGKWHNRYPRASAD